MTASGELQRLRLHANVCGIRRKADGYWWECNGEHGAGWNSKRIRQAWTYREATQHVIDMVGHGVFGLDEVEIVELFPHDQLKPR